MAVLTKKVEGLLNGAKGELMRGEKMLYLKRERTG